MEVGKPEARRFTVKSGELRSYREDRIGTLKRSFFAMLESFQIEVFLFLVSTNGEKGRFKKLFKKHLSFIRNVPAAELGELKFSRALDICLDIGFLKARWHERDKVFCRQFENEHEATGLVRKIAHNFINGETGKNTVLFRSLD